MAAADGISAWGRHGSEWNESCQGWKGGLMDLVRAERMDDAYEFLRNHPAESNFEEFTAAVLCYPKGLELLAHYLNNLLNSDSTTTHLYSSLQHCDSYGRNTLMLAAYWSLESSLLKSMISRCPESLMQQDVEGRDALEYARHLKKRKVRPVEPGSHEETHK
jgi:hypothetical protein